MKNSSGERKEQKKTLEKANSRGASSSKEALLLAQIKSRVFDKAL
jgi:hypothetical protein